MDMLPFGAEVCKPVALILSQEVAGSNLVERLKAVLGTVYRSIICC
jgi:hypothetical protein